MGLIGFLTLPLLPLPCLEDAADTVNITLVVISAVKEKEKTCLRMEREREEERAEKETTTFSGHRQKEVRIVYTARLVYLLYT